MLNTRSAPCCPKVLARSAACPKSSAVTEPRSASASRRASPSTSSELRTTAPSACSTNTHTSLLISTSLPDGLVHDFGNVAHQQRFAFAAAGSGIVEHRHAERAGGGHGACTGAARFGVADAVDLP